MATSTTKSKPSFKERVKRANNRGDFASVLMLAPGSSLSVCVLHLSVYLDFSLRLLRLQRI